LALRTSSPYKRLGRTIPAADDWLRLRHYRPPIRSDLARIIRSTYWTLGSAQQDDVGMWGPALHRSVVSRECRLAFAYERVRQLSRILLYVTRSSDLSLAISDYMSTPLLCTKSSPWWSAIPQFELPDTVTQSREKDDVCARQAALIAFVLLTAVMYVANMILSLFRIMERIRVVAKQYAKADAQQI